MKSNEKFFLGVLIAVFTALYASISIIRNIRLESFAYDLGIYDQAIWQFSNFQIPYSTIKNSYLFADHFFLWGIIFAPLYWITNNVNLLLFFQSLAVAIGAAPLYLISKKYTKSIFLSLVFSLCYLMFFGIQNGIIFDFHPILIAVPLIGFWLYFLEKSQWRLLAINTILILGLQENLALLVAALGIMIMFEKQKRKMGVVIFVLAVVWFTLIITLLRPLFTHEQFNYFPTKSITSPAMFVTELFIPIEKTKTILISLGSFAFLPLLSPVMLIPVLEQFVERFMGNVIATRWGIGLHYSALLAPLLIYASIRSINKYFYRKNVVIIIGIVLIIISFGYQYMFHLPINLLSKKEYYNQATNKVTIDKVSKLIGTNTALATLNNLVPLYSHRNNIYVLSSCAGVPDPSRGMSCEPMVGKISKDLPLIEQQKVELVLVDFRSGQNPNNYFPDGEENIKLYVNDLLLRNKYKEIFNENKVILLKRV